MVELALIIGIFSNFILALGLIGKLHPYLLKLLSFLFLSLIIVLTVIKRKEIRDFFLDLKGIKKDKLLLFLILVFALAVLVNLIGVWGPELGFDALWYHLTLPKIYLQTEKIFFIPGGLFYYSAMPKLTEMLYLPTLIFSPEGILAKFIHFLFGILSAISLYKLNRRFLNQKFSLLATLIFYTSLVVGWESTTAYVDLSRCFFEILSLDLLLSYLETKKQKFLLESAITMGLSLSVKLIAFFSLLSISLFMFIKIKKPLSVLKFVFTAILIPLPWFIFSYLNTGNPFYPVFEKILDSSHLIPLPGLFRFLKDTWILFYKPQDPHSFIYLAFFPLVAISYLKETSSKFKDLFLYFIFCLVFWYLTPRTGGSRFFIPYLPVLSLLTVLGVNYTRRFYQKIFLLSCLICFSINISYRFLANSKFLPVILNKVSKDQFLSQHLNFENGDFLDPKQEIKKIVKNELVLIYCSHNLFYADFPFVHESYAPPDLPYSYVLTQNCQPPKTDFVGNLIYENVLTKTKLYFYKGKIQ